MAIQKSFYIKAQRNTVCQFVHLIKQIMYNAFLLSDFENEKNKLNLPSTSK